MLDTAKLGQFVGQVWNDSIVPTLVDYIRIPNKSPAFDPDWAAHGHMEAAVAMFEGWARERFAALPGATLDVVRLPGRTPLILIEVPGSASKANTDTVLLYGHLDKQPEMVGWAEGYGPWIPRLEGDKLYGRGGADDGYAMFGALAALLGLRDQGVPHARCVIVIEACEESGSYDLPNYIDHLAERAKLAAAALGDSVYTKFPFAGGTRPMSDDRTELVLNRTWRPQLAVIGIDGLPPPADAGNVLLPHTTAKLSLRLPPTVDAEKAGDALKKLLEADPPLGARVVFAPQAASAG